MRQRMSLVRVLEIRIVGVDLGQHSGHVIRVEYVDPFIQKFVLDQNRNRCVLPEFPLGVVSALGISGLSRRIEKRLNVLGISDVD